MRNASFSRNASQNFQLFLTVRLSVLSNSYLVVGVVDNWMSLVQLVTWRIDRWNDSGIRKAN